MEFWELPLFGAFIAMTTVCLLSWILLKNLIKNRKEIAQKVSEDFFRDGKAEVLIREHLNNWDIEAEIDPLLDKRLDSLVDHLKIQIPMAAMFLSGQMVTQLKGLAKEELVKLLPEIKQKLAEKAGSSELELQATLLIQQGIDHFLRDVVQPRIPVWLAKGCFYSGFAALLLGIIERIAAYNLAG